MYAIPVVQRWSVDLLFEASRLDEDHQSVEMAAAVAAFISLV